MSSSLLKLRVSSLKKEGLSALRVVFEPHEGLTNYRCGQFLTLVVHPPGSATALRRSYSLCSAPETGAAPSVLIKRLVGGAVSGYLIDHLRVGNQLDSLPPMGRFTLPTQSSLHYVMVAGGSGITPLFSLAQGILARDKASRILLLYASQQEADILLRQDIYALSQAHPGRLMVKHYLSRQPTSFQAADTDNLQKGRLDKGSLQADLDAFMGPKADKQLVNYMLCAPRALQEAARSWLLAQAISDKNIHYESFVAGETFPNISSPAFESKVVVVMDDATHDLGISSSQTILGAGLEAGLDLPYSCQKGVCTTCRAKLVEGEVSYDRPPDGLNEEEIAQGYILCCQAKPASPTLQLHVE